METTTNPPKNLAKGVANDQTQFGCQIIFILGPPGAGKGTLCKRLIQEFEFCHISVGDHLRALCDPLRDHESAAFGGLSRETIQTNLKDRKLLDSEPLVAIIHNKLEQEQKTGQTIIILDGFPRSDGCAKRFEEAVGHEHPGVLEFKY